MRRMCAALLAVLLCLNLNACVMMGTPNNNQTEPPKVEADFSAPAEIAFNESEKEEEAYYNDNGICIGYYRFTYGTNCGVEGLMRLEFLDMNRTVKNTYEPKVASTTLSYHRWGGNNITDIWESNYQGNNTSSNYYLVYPYSDGDPYAYMEQRNGATVRCDLYGTDGAVVASLTPENPTRRLEVVHYEANCFWVYESFFEELSNGSHNCNARVLTYSLQGQLLCELVNDYVINTEKNQPEVIRCQIKNSAGEVIRTYEQTAPGFELTVSYDPQQREIYATESVWLENPVSIMRTFKEYVDISTGTVLYSEMYTYEGEDRVRTDYTVLGGTLVATVVENGNMYTKLEFYDAAGTLKKCVEAQEGQLLYFQWDSLNRWINIDIYEESGRVGSETYCG